MIDSSFGGSKQRDPPVIWLRHVALRSERVGIPDAVERRRKRSSGRLVQSIDAAPRDAAREPCEPSPFPGDVPCDFTAAKLQHRANQELETPPQKSDL
jgi:hypothetical protein